MLKPSRDFGFLGEPRLTVPIVGIVSLDFLQGNRAIQLAVVRGEDLSEPPFRVQLLTLETDWLRGEAPPQARYPGMESRPGPTYRRLPKQAWRERWNPRGDPSRSADGPQTRSRATCGPRSRAPRSGRGSPLRKSRLAARADPPLAATARLKRDPIAWQTGRTQDLDPSRKHPYGQLMTLRRPEQAQVTVRATVYLRGHAPFRGLRSSSPESDPVSKALPLSRAWLPVPSVRWSPLSARLTPR